MGMNQYYIPTIYGKVPCFAKSTQSLRLVHKSGTKAVVICLLLRVMFHDLYLSVEGIKVIGFVLFA